VLGFGVVTGLKQPAGLFFTLGERHGLHALLAGSPQPDPVAEREVGLRHVALQLENLGEL